MPTRHHVRVGRAEPPPAVGTTDVIVKLHVIDVCEGPGLLPIERPGQHNAKGCSDNPDAKEDVEGGEQEKVPVLANTWQARVTLSGRGKGRQGKAREGKGRESEKQPGVQQLRFEREGETSSKLWIALESPYPTVVMVQTQK